MLNNTKIFGYILFCCLWSFASVLTYAYLAGHLRFNILIFSHLKASHKEDSLFVPTKHNETTVTDYIPANSKLKSKVHTDLDIQKTNQAHPTKPVKSILLWDEVWWFKPTEIRNDFCGWCPITRNRSLVYHKDTAAVVINVWSRTPSNPPIDQRRRFDQLYVFWATESPGKTLHYGKYKVNLNLYPPHYFNATMTYRRDSTFYQSNERHDVLNVIRSSWRGVEKSTHKLLAMKTKKAVFIASNCDYGSFALGRIKLVQEMVDLGFQVDRFGRCFPDNKFPLPKKMRNSAEFFRFLEKYKFFLSFENSLHCRDYITEKFWTHGLSAGLLPIVAGATKEDYLAVAPPYSFVHVEDFETTGDLVDYLHYLDSNQTAYAKYFEWRNKNAIKYYRYGKSSGFCALCRSLHGISIDDIRSHNDFYKNRKNDGYESPAVNQTISSIHKWWHGDETEECLNVTRN